MSPERAIERAVEEQMPLARRLAERFRKSGVDPDVLESDAVMALWAAARRAYGGNLKVKDFRAFATSRIRLELFKSVRDAPYSHLADVPIRLRDAAEKCERGAEALMARGILRPTAEQLAGESMVSIERAEQVLALTNVVVRQSAVEWADMTGRTAVRNPVASLEPLFGVGFFTETSPCPHHGPIPLHSKLVCMVCHETGFDHYPEMKRSPATDPPPYVSPPEPEKAPPPGPPIVIKTETRAVRRQRLRDKLAAASKGDRCTVAT